MSGAADGALVRAAGAVCWHRGDDGLRVLLVHRPRYQDWSWPKGKLEGPEPVVAAAVRELAEETGLVRPLGVPLPSARYPLGTDATKHVSYWAAHVPGPALPPPPRPDEVDETAWVTPEEADRRLTRRADRVQLRALLDADAGGALDTWPLVVLRHAHAHPRTGWDGTDADRPLAPPGMAQARALPELLTAWSPLRVVSSPWERCVQTLEPYLYATGTRLRTKRRLSEDGHRTGSAAVAHYVSGLLAKARPVLVCTHRPVLPTLLGTLAGHAGAGVAEAVPRADPYLQPGEVLVAHVARRSGRVVAVERHSPVPR
ncbi:NUDIX hydrolase [Quadrisphaera sp. DSM 44207]|uniref:NUDIX hydrolase n=1 Tax=Quadrisphaera sp. DSM 44207 TaxID=1881057 RepID=UPI00088F30F9|nr:NUDIX hydrolase [Quadrisphaera sp. DSM 44207]SDQ84339.1 8-oxo-dGTP diphosphatase [Quadrisphaera sp. DSM 44207]